MPLCQDPDPQDAIWIAPRPCRSAQAWPRLRGGVGRGGQGEERDVSVPGIGTGPHGVALPSPRQVVNDHGLFITGWFDMREK